MESDTKKLNVEYSFVNAIRRSVSVKDADNNEVDIGVIAQKVQEVTRASIIDFDLKGFPDELVLAVNIARRLPYADDERVFIDGITIFFGIILAAYMESHKYTVTTEVADIDEDDFVEIENRFERRFEAKAKELSQELISYMNSLSKSLEDLRAKMESVNEDPSISEERSRSEHTEVDRRGAEEDPLKLPVEGND